MSRCSCWIAVVSGLLLVASGGLAIAQCSFGCRMLTLMGGTHYDGNTYCYEFPNATGRLVWTPNALQGNFPVSAAGNQVVAYALPNSLSCSPTCDYSLQPQEPAKAGWVAWGSGLWSNYNCVQK